MRDSVTIGGACGFWGDSTLGTRQLITRAQCDYLIYDGLAEITMGLLTRARKRDPDLGYATHIIEDIAANLKEFAQRGTRIVTNAGGMNPLRAASLIEEAAESAGLRLKVASVTGDDLTPHVSQLRDSGICDLEHGEPIPDELLSFSAYLGAGPVAAALDAGAEVVITGRIADSALVLGPLIHEFRWRADDWDLLAQGSLAGHLIECGPQATGGLFTDWDDVPSWSDIGYPIVRCAADGSFELTKPPGTGGLVSVATVAEQLLYEIGDPANYLLPDVTCDWTQVEIQQVGPHRVHVSGGIGKPPGQSLKANAYFTDGATVAATMFVGGRDAPAKARRLADELLERIRVQLVDKGFSELREGEVDVLGAESTYGPNARIVDSREVVLRIGLHHDDSQALQAAVRELPSFGLVVPGLSLGGSGPPRPTARLVLRSFLVPRELVQVSIRVGSLEVPYREATRAIELITPGQPPDVAVEHEVEDPVTVPLIAIAHGRSGDKGPHSNIGVRARHPDFWPAVLANVTESACRRWLGHIVGGVVHRYQLPGIYAVNLLLHDSLGGGGMASLRVDPQGKAHAQQLLDMPVTIPRSWLDHPALFEIPEGTAARATA